MGATGEDGTEFVRQAAAGILTARPVYAEVIGFYGELFLAQEEIRPRVRTEPFRLAAEMVQVKRREHLPLIQVEEMRFDPEAGLSLFEDVCRIAVDRRTALSAPAQTLRKRSAEASALFQGFLGEDENRIKQAAADFGVETAALSFFLYHSLRPSLCRCEQDLAGFVVDESYWEKGYCPVCGSQPAMAQLDAEGRRFLFCSFCCHRWPAPRTACPFCGNVSDVVPAGPGLLNAGSLTWPESGHRMSLVAVRLAFDHNVRIAIDERHSVRVAATPAIVVMKMVAFLDRPDREDDLTDIAQVVERYLGPVDDRRWTLPVDFDDASAFALGTDVGLMIDERERPLVMEFLAGAKDESDRHLTHALLIRNGPWYWREHPEALLDRLAAFEKGIRDAPASS